MLFNIWSIYCKIYPRILVYLWINILRINSPEYKCVIYRFMTISRHKHCVIISRNGRNCRHYPWGASIIQYIWFICRIYFEILSVSLNKTSSALCKSSNPVISVMSYLYGLKHTSIFLYDRAYERDKFLPFHNSLIYLSVLPSNHPYISSISHSIYPYPYWPYLLNLSFFFNKNLLYSLWTAWSYWNLTSEDDISWP